MLTVYLFNHWKMPTKPDSPPVHPEGMTDKRLAEITRDLHAGRLPNHEARQALIREVTRLRRSSSETAQLGEALVAALAGLRGGTALVVRCWLTSSPDVEIWDDVTANDSDTYETDATRHLAALLASSQREAKT